MTGNEIEWLFDDCQSERNNGQKSNVADLASMSIGEELAEIAVPLSHPIGAAGIQLIGVAAGYDCAIRVEHQTKTEISLERSLLAIIAIMMIFTFICMKYRLPGYVSWIPFLLVGLAAWLAIEWSLF